MTKHSTIYDAEHLDELRSYTMRLLNLLEAKGFFREDALEDFRSTFLDVQGNVNFDMDENTRQRSGFKNLEHIIWQGKPFYYCYSDSSLYTFSANPVRIGTFDHDTMTAIVLN